ncbi:MAG TPA: primosomal protein N' [Candidatus Nanoarchaeia archaeon]|nr:primosomal protein N' [Candidatus Nanoarchaeia archaeon]
MTKAKKYWLISPTESGGADEFAYTYEYGDDLAMGQLVEVPFGRKKSLGVVIAEAEKPTFETKPVTRLIELPLIPAHLVELAKWLASYYLASPKAVWQTLLPAGLETKAASPRKKPLPEPEGFEEPGVNKAQQAALDAVWNGQETSYLLHGITGSGKTQVYIELARKSIESGRSAIILVPEIALTPQIEARFKTAFPGAVIPTHSGLTPAGRRSAWFRALIAEEPQVVIGPRSALFLPLAKVGIIVMDECHETTYKQEQSPKYQTDAAAAKLAHLAGAKLVMGSATPAVTQYFWAKEGRIKLLEMTERANRITPAIPTVVDLRDKTLLNASRFISTPLLDAVKSTLAEGRQSLLFINRRGSASSLICGDCGWVASCPNCGIAITFHADHMKLVCHYCNYRQTPPAICPDDKSTNLRYLGGGTKRIEAEMARLMPEARLARLDRDSSTPAYLHQLYGELNAGKIDILIGTQLVAKGWDLPMLDTVGIVSADTMLNVPDFTAAERTFQLITQVRGRAGRGDRAGQVIIQSYSPDHPAIMAAAEDDYERFATTELAGRQALHYPPFTYLLKLSFGAKTAETSQRRAQELSEQLRGLQGVALSGPAPAFREVQGGRYIWQIIARSHSRQSLIGVAAATPAGWTADLDPVNLL